MIGLFLINKSSLYAFSYGFPIELNATSQWNLGRASIITDLDLEKENRQEWKYWIVRNVGIKGTWALELDRPVLEKERSWSFGKIKDSCWGFQSEMKCNSEQQMGRENLGKEKSQEARTGSQRGLKTKTLEWFRDGCRISWGGVRSDRASLAEEMQMKLWRKKVKVWEWIIPPRLWGQIKLESRAVMGLMKSK